MDTLDLANDYVNLSWEEFKAKHEDRAASGGYGLPLMRTEITASFGRDVPISRDGKVQTS